MGPANGAQACGDTGPGRMLEPEELALRVEQFFPRQAIAVMTGRRFEPSQGKTVVVTAGPTREAIDPVRYISNHSSGKWAMPWQKLFAGRERSSGLFRGQPGWPALKVFSESMWSLLRTCIKP